MIEMFFGPFFIIFLCQSVNVLPQTTKCVDYIDITDGEKQGTFITKNGITFSEKDYFYLGDTIKGCICDVKQCIRKCCPEGQKMNFTSKECVSDIDTFLDDFSVYHIINVPKNTICDETKVKVVVDGQFEVVNGTLVTDFGDFSVKDYCLSKNGDVYAGIGCVTYDQLPGLLSSIGMIISMPFLLATFLVYALLPESNLHRRALMSYVLTLLLAYIILVGVQLSGEIPPLGCHLLGYSIVFFFTVSFFWMNVMCIDMWLTFRGMRGYGGRKKAERKRFIIYSIYAWGMPLLHVLMVFLLNTYGDESSPFHPALGAQRCFVGEGLPNFLYFYCLTMIIIIINIILFMLTGIKIYQVKKDTSMLKHSDSNKHSYEDDKQQFKLYVKLLFAMGINWVTEIISWAIAYFWQETPEALFYLTDFVNATYGVFIFFIFVFKRKIWKSLKKRYYICIGKPHLAQVMSTTRNRTSNYSTTATTDTGVNMTEMRNGKEEERALNRI